MTLTHRLKYSQCLQLDRTLSRYASIARIFEDPSSDFAPRLESVGTELRNFHDAFARDPKAIASLEDVLFKMGGNLLSLKAAPFLKSLGKHASARIAHSVDSFYVHVNKIHDHPNLLSSYLTGKFSACDVNMS